MSTLSVVLALLGCRGDGREADSRASEGGDDPAVETTASAAPYAPEDPFAGIEALRPRPWAAWPVENIDIEGYDGWRIDPVHGGFERDRGLRFDVDAGAFVLAIADGVVSEVRARDDRQLELVLDHGHGIESHYAPLSDGLAHAGLPVTRGAAIGLASGDALELAITVDGIDLDPLLILRQPLHRWPALQRTLPTPAPEPAPP